MLRSTFRSTFTSQSPNRLLVIAFGSFVVVLLLFLLSHNFYSGSSTVVDRVHWGSTSTGGQSSLNHIWNSTLGFEKVLALNLPERRDHRDALVIASAVSGFHIDFVEGVRGDTVQEKTLPVLHNADVKAGAVGAWRAHMDALAQVVDNNWGSALIFEDDADWDIRVKPMLENFARASNAVLQMKEGPGIFGLDKLQGAKNPTTSPYGDGWDVLWLGHCHMKANQSSPVIVHKDDTTPLLHYLPPDNPEDLSPLRSFPEHTRAVSRFREGICSLGYAVSQAGARKLLYEIGIEQFTEAFDLMLQHFCDGTFGMAHRHNCLSVLPPIFAQNRPAGSTSKDSDIEDGNDFREQAFTPYIRNSVLLNLETLVHGETDLTDQFPD